MSEPASESNPIPSTEPSTGLSTSTSIVAKPSAWYRGKWLLMSLVLIGWSPWFIYDGFSKYQAENDTDKAAGRTQRHPTYDIPANKILGVLMPPLGLFGIVWTLYRTRGKYELEGEMLSVPGHPGVPLPSIQSVDRRKWDRKGIAVIMYESGEKKGTFKLDDFLYDREPTDEIFKRIEAAVTSPG